MNPTLPTWLLIASQATTWALPVGIQAEVSSPFVHVAAPRSHGRAGGASLLRLCCVVSVARS